MPYYDQSMNLMNTGIASGQGGYNDGVYHDTPPNRYDRIYIFSRKFNYCDLFTSNGYCIDQKHLIKCIQLYIIFGTFIQNVLYYCVQCPLSYRKIYVKDIAIKISPP